MCEHGWPLLGCADGHEGHRPIDPDFCLHPRVPPKTRGPHRGTCPPRWGWRRRVTPPRDLAVEPGDWLGSIAALRDEGCEVFDFLTAVDRGQVIEVVVRVMNPATKAATMVWTTVPADAAELASLSEHYLGATWCERETAEMFGVRFMGLADQRPLLLRARLGRPPLLKESVLVARAVREWPGAAQATDDGRQGGNPSRRRQLPPGVPDDFLRPDRSGLDQSAGTT
ncbi:MAG: hypothetical protein F2697_08565 [Actinobacteria bacterium]|nr:hypothetical protein [Actinomycetota bacterium]